MSAEQALAELGPVSPAGPLVALTNADGFFLFRDLPKGSYSLTANAPGYLAGVHGRAHVDGPGRPVVLDDGQRVTEATIKIWKPAVITGTVFDDHGDPAVGVQVRSVERLGSGFGPGGIATTDDRGLYRLSNLRPGEHLVLVTSKVSSLPTSIGNALRQPGPAANALRQELSGTGNVLVGVIFGGTEGIKIGDVELQQQGNTVVPQVNANDEIIVAPTAFHPSSLSPRTATAVRAEAGREQSGIDLRLRTVVGHKVSGTVTASEGPVSNLPLRLLPSYIDHFSSDANQEAGVTVTDSAGRFTFLGIPPGDYSIRVTRVPRRAATSAPVRTTVAFGDGGMIMSSGTVTPQPLAPPLEQPTLSATLAITIGERDLTDVMVVLTEGARITGQVIFEGGTRPPASEAPRFGVAALPAGNRTGVGLPLPVPIDATGQFTTSQYPPGSYFLSVSGAPAGWSLSQALVNGINATQHPIQLAGKEIGGAVLTMTKTLASISGGVRRADASGDPRAQVLAFPADYSTWIDEGLSQRLVYRTAVAPNGTFNLPALLSGGYFIVALDASVRVDTQRADVITALAREATRVTLADGQAATQPLTVTVLR
jgi:hypothetical protein